MICREGNSCVDVSGGLARASNCPSLENVNSKTNPETILWNISWSRTDFLRWWAGRVAVSPDWGWNWRGLTWLERHLVVRGSESQPVNYRVNIVNTWHLTGWQACKDSDPLSDILVELWVLWHYVTPVPQWGLLVRVFLIKKTLTEHLEVWSLCSCESYDDVILASLLPHEFKLLFACQFFQLFSLQIVQNFTDAHRTNSSLNSHKVEETLARTGAGLSCIPWKWRK